MEIASKNKSVRILRLVSGRYNNNENQRRGTCQHKTRVKMKKLERRIFVAYYYTANRPFKYYRLFIHRVYCANSGFCSS